MSFPRPAAVVLVAALLLICCTPHAAFGAASDPCSLLTEAEASAALGASVSVGDSVPGEICRWSTPGGQPGRSPAVVVTMQDAHAFDFAKAPSKSASLVKTPLGGVEQTKSIDKTLAQEIVSRLK